MEEKNEKKGGHIDKLIMGVILGGAIGSVLGLTLAPRKGKETREILKKKGAELIAKGKEASGQLIRDNREKIESAKYQIKRGRGFLRWLFGSKKTREPMPHVSIPEEKEK